MAALFGLEFRRVRRQGEFAPALAAVLSNPGVTLIEVQIDRERSQLRALRQLSHEFSPYRWISASIFYRLSIRLFTVIHKNHWQKTATTEWR